MKWAGHVRHEGNETFKQNLARYPIGKRQFGNKSTV
jgi:hypothetical protein